MEKTRNRGYVIRDNIVNLYNVEKNSKGLFFLQIDWLLENAVYPLESGYADNLVNLWNVYMPKYKFDKVILDYSKMFFPVLRFIHDREISNFNSTKIMLECAVKNYLKYCISQGQTNRMELVTACFDLFKGISDRTKLYDIINMIIEHYFVNGEVEQYGVMFLKRFQDYTEQPYKSIVERLSDIYEQKEQALQARPSLLNALNVQGERANEVNTLINVVLCRIALADGESKFSDILKDTWNRTVKNITYNENIYSFIKKYEKAYMNAACYGIKNIVNKQVIKRLYKDSVIMCAVLKAIENKTNYSIKEVNDFWKNDGMHFAGGFFFDDEFERMKDGFNPSVLISYKEDILTFHDALIDKIKTNDSGFSYGDQLPRNERKTNSEMDSIVLNVKDRQIDELQERITELEEKVDNTEKEVLSQFISLLDSKKYDHVLGKLYRTAYVDKTVQIDDIQRILKNLFEIMNISGIDVYGEVESKVRREDIRKGKYRVNCEIKQEGKVKYPGYKVGNSVILHPLVEEE